MPGESLMCPAPGSYSSLWVGCEGEMTGSLWFQSVPWASGCGSGTLRCSLLREVFEQYRHHFWSFQFNVQPGGSWHALLNSCSIYKRFYFTQGQQVLVTQKKWTCGGWLCRFLNWEPKSGNGSDVGIQTLWRGDGWGKAGGGRGAAVFRDVKAGFLRPASEAAGLDPL